MPWLSVSWFMWKKEQLLTNGIPLLASRTERFKRSFFPSTTTLWTDISFDIRCLESIGSFIKALFPFYNVPSYNATYDFAIDRFNAIFHTRSRLDTCALNYYLFKVGCRESPVCFCGFHNETVEHFFLNVHFILPLGLICSPLLLAFMLTGCLLCLKHKIYQLFCLDHHFCLRRKIMIYFFHFQSFIYESMRCYKST